MPSSSPARTGRDYAYLCFGPLALLAILAWVVDNVPMSFADRQGYAMVFGLPLVMGSLVALPAALVMAAIHRREWPLPVLAGLTVGVVAAAASGVAIADDLGLACGLIVLAAEAAWFGWRRRRPVEDAPAGPLGLGLRS